MYSLNVWHFVALSIVFSAMPQWVSAQQPPSPPQLEILEEGEPPAVTIKPPARQETHSEKRNPGGKVTEIKVTSGKSTYYLKANDPVGSALPGDGQSSPRAAQWEILQFDLAPPNEERTQETQAITPEPPTRPSPASRK